MEIFCKEEVCQIVKEFVKQFMRWEGYIPEEIDDTWKSFIKEEKYTKIRFKRLIKVEEVNVEDLDADRTL